jgi:prepilin-type N-terminal cleavage/methylation domain-containing protein
MPPIPPNVPPYLPPAASRRRRGGFTLVEVLVAALIVALGLTATYVLSSQCLQIAASSHNSTAATQILQEQTERLRSADFSVLLTSGSLKAFLEANPLVSGNNLAALNKMTSTVQLSSCLYSGSAATSGTISVQSAAIASGTTQLTILLSGTLKATTVQAKVSLGWIEHSGSHSRTTTTFITRYD